MGSIYTKAREVVVWLGQGSISTQSLFALMQQPRYCLDALRSSEVEHYLRSIHRMCQLPYWFRIWVIQELLFAARISLMSENSLIEWEKFWTATRALLNLSEKWNLAAETRNGILNSLAYRHRVQKGLRKSLARSHASTSLNDLLLKYKESRCTLVRDRVVGLMSLVEGGNTFQHSYSGSDSDFVLRACAHFGGNLETLGRLRELIDVKPAALYHESLSFRQFRLESTAGDTKTYSGQILCFEVGHGYSFSGAFKCRTCASTIAHISPTLLHSDISVYCLRGMGTTRHLFVASNGAHVDVRTSYRIFFDHGTQDFDRFDIKTFEPIFESFAAFEPLSTRTTKIYMTLDLFVRLAQHLRLPEAVSTRASIPPTSIETSITSFQMSASSVSLSPAPTPGAWPYLGDALLLAPVRDGKALEKCFAYQIG